jgi:UDP-N-acetylmuramoylalanine--D-glutamate ligase
MEEYKEAKENIYKYQTKGSVLVLNKDNAITDVMDRNTDSYVRKFSVKEKIAEGSYFENNNLYVYGKKVCEKKDVKLKGMHNVENLLAAFSMTYDDASIDAMREVAINFRGVEHRSEFVAEINGVEYYNDSIASSPTRTIAGLKAFEKQVILIAGGYDKKIPFEALSEGGYPYIKKLILLGATKEKIKEAFEKESKTQERRIDTYVVENLDEAVIKAREISEEGDIVTLSPACASFDQFVNFEMRGLKYKEIVNDMAEKSF